MLNFVHQYRYYILGLLFALTVVGFWPGVAMHDSSLQYQQAVQAQYSDHHPPMMSFVWHYLNQLHPGSGLMFGLQLVLLYGGVAVLLRTANYVPFTSRVITSLILVLLPIYPQILIYEVVILKDVQFASGFLLSAAILAYYTILNKRLPVGSLFILLSLLIYAAAVKFQAQYCVIILAIWLGCLLNLTHSLWRKVAAGLAIYALILCAIFGINSTLVPNHAKDQAWQYVKLYDLAAMSLRLDTDLIPEPNKTTNYSFTQLQQRFKYPAIDSLVFMSDPILSSSKNQTNMDDLYQHWLKAIITHPMIYLKHRAINMRYILLTRPGYEREVQDIPFAITNNFAPNSLAYTLAEYTIGIVFYLFMSNLPVIILGIGYFILALRSRRTAKSAPVLLGLSSTALLMVILLFFMSMAGTPRYTYVSILLIHSAHIFAYSCFKQSSAD